MAIQKWNEIHFEIIISSVTLMCNLTQMQEKRKSSLRFQLKRVTWVIQGFIDTFKKFTRWGNKECI